MRRIEGADKVSGSLIFTEDMALAGLLHVRLVLSYVASASVRAIHAEHAARLAVDPSRVRVVPMPVGGGFGGKILQLEPLVARLSRHVGRPVRLQLTRSDDFLLGRPAPSSEVALELGAAADGGLIGLRAEVGYDNGAATGWHAGITSELLV